MSFITHRDAHVYTLKATTTLTASLNDTLRAFQNFGQQALDLEIYYIPKNGESNRTCTIFLEYGTDGSNYVPLTKPIADITDGHDVLIQNPITILGVTGGTTYGAKVRLAELLPNMRVSAKEDGSSNFGTVKIVGTFS